MTRKEFEKLVLEALQSLPKRFRDRLENIDVVVEEGSGDEDLLGLYEGVPLGERTGAYSMALPDKITLFKRALEVECEENGTDLKEEIRCTVEHEIAHHFGMSDEALEEGGIY